MSILNFARRKILFGFMVFLVTTKPVATHAIEPITIAIGTAIAGTTYLVEKNVLDPLWDEQYVTGEKRIDILEDRLKTYQYSLEKVDKNLANRIAKFRKELSLRTTPDDVRRIIESSLTSLRNRMNKLEMRVDNLEVRVQVLEEAVFPGGTRFLNQNGEKFTAKADVFRFMKHESRPWRDKQNGPLAEGMLTEVSPDGVTITNFIEDEKIDEMIAWSKLSAADQHYIMYAVKNYGWPVNGIWKKIN